MPRIADLLVGFVALVHVGFSLAEIFLWKQPFVHQRLGFTQAEADKAAPIVANAGLYNGFVAAGLIWGVLAGVAGDPIKVFFLVCVIIAGIFGTVTLKRWLPIVFQTLTGLIALIAVWRTSVPD
jgi:putative membrane protein